LCKDSNSLKHARWGVEVVFDSGGFFMQEGKVIDDELFPPFTGFLRPQRFGRGLRDARLCADVP
jgi:hypothetical protein